MSLAAAKAVWKQVVIIALVLSIQALSAVGAIPPQSQLVDYLKEFFATYGALAIGVCSIVENIVVVNVYFPGSIVILTGMASTAGDPYRAFTVFWAIALPSMCAQTVNYCIGRIRQKTQASASKLPVWEMAIAFWHPQTASVASVRAGNSGWTLSEYLRRMLPISLGWYTFWALTMYFFGSLGRMTSSLVALFYAYLIIWTVQDLRAFVLAKDSAVGEDPGC